MLFPEIDDSNDTEQQRLDIEWITVSAVRDAVSMGLRQAAPLNYRKVVNLCKQLIPVLFYQDRSLLERAQESSDVREYRQKAEALEEKEGRNVDPLEILNKEIEELESFTRTKSGRGRDVLVKRLNKLRQIRTIFQQKEYEEDTLIKRDYNIGGNLPISREGDGYREIDLPDNRMMRIRILHPTKLERVTGADLIYEHYHRKDEKVRIVAVQYKIWRKQSPFEPETLYESQAENLETQLAKLRTTFCDNLICARGDENKEGDAYRFPYCSAFLRPTDQLQKSDIHLISAGYHIPVCLIDKLWVRTRKGRQKLTLDVVRPEAVTHRVFEELFNTNKIGSRWLTYEELETFYEQHKLLEVGEHLIVHTQDFEYA
jgi:hypothetical protein